ncbi:MAG TPA: hypothetical protein VFA55_08375, partial [Candidatus Kapabacteria bacterium]|nr:hypothetical protein [Candidatus Kapabacteria bacterium]
AQYDQFFVNSNQTIYSAFFSGNTKAYMALLSGGVGGEYTMGRRTDIFNAFARAGINGNVIHGSVDLGTEMNTVVYSEFRLGAEGEIGGRLNFSGTPLAVELGLDYTNANLTGKSYAAPTVQPPYPLSSRTLNDGANPNDPNDQSRTIDFVSLRIGAVVRM